MTVTAYISAAAGDAAPAQALRQELEGLSISHSIGGPDLRTEATLRQLHQAVAEAKCLIVLISPHGEADDWVRREVLMALNNGRTVIPVLVGEARPDAWPRLLLDMSAQIDARRGMDRQTLDAIVNAVRAVQGAGRVISMLNIKGGVGKTVLAANLFAAAHVVNEQSICFVDLDPQHNLSQYFLPPIERNRLRDEANSVYAVLASKGDLSAPREKFASLAAPLNRGGPRQGVRPRLDLICGDDRLFEFTLDAKTLKEKDAAYARFHQLINTLRARYQTVVIDTNPCATFLTRCAITACDHIVAPVRPEKYSLSGLTMLEWVTREIRERPVKSSEFSVILNGVGDRVRSRANDVDAQTRNEIEMAPFFSAALIKTAVPYSGLLRATPDDRYAVNPINVTAVMRLAQRTLKETLTAAAAEILERAKA